MAPEPTVAAAAAGPAPGRDGTTLTASGLRRGGVLYSAGNFFGMGLGFLSSAAMVRAAPPAQVASYLLLLQAATAVALVLQLGLTQGALRFAPVARGEGGETATRLLRRRLLVLQVGAWMVLAPPIALAWPTIARRLDAPELARSWPWLLATAMLASLARVADAYLRAFRFYTASAVLTHVVPRGLVLAGFATLALTRPGQVSWGTLAAIFVGAQLAVALAYAGCLPATTPGEVSEPRAAQAPPGTWNILSTTTAMGLRGAASILMASSDLWILSWARTHHEVAVYGVVSRIVAAMSAIPLAANFLLPQEFAVLYADGRKAELERLARTAATAAGLLSLLALGGILVLGRPLIRLAFGPSYLAGWSVLLVLALGSFWDAASGSAGYVLQMTGQHLTLLALTLGAAALNLLLSLAVAPRWGGLGVAAATATTLILLNVANVAAARRKLGVRTFVYLRRQEWAEVARLLATGRRRPPA